MVDMIGKIAITIVCILGIVAAVWAFVTYTNIPIPPLFMTLFWIVAGVLLVCGAIWLIVKMWRQSP